MRRLRGIGLGFAATLIAITAVAPALADNRLFTFPDPAIQLVRRFAPQKLEMLDTGIGPMALINLPTTYPIGTQLRIQGNVAAIGGLSGIVVIYEYGLTSDPSRLVLTTTGPFDQVITITAPTNRIAVTGSTATSAEITALTIDEVI
ncbi:MAG TPA: hypothetical protein VFP12_11475 [Allosphingosinicella sp.]|nr:hypothetical protein [Allosphingosinicella sp.]